MGNGNGTVKKQALLDLSQASDHGLALILMRVPAKELLQTCALVSRQWLRTISDASFWRNKAELEQYGQEWRLLANQSLPTLQRIVAKRPFARNFCRDSWDLSKRDVSCYRPDPRWIMQTNVVWTNHNNGRKPQIEVPPKFLDTPRPLDPDTGEEIQACLALSYPKFVKRIVIKLSDEGLSDELMDKFRPTIVVSELVANRRDCGCRYMMRALLTEAKPTTLEAFHFDNMEFQSLNPGLDQHGEGPSQSTETEIQEKGLNFAQWTEEKWCKLEFVFDGYKAGMRYLVVKCAGKDTQFWAGNYGPKIANFAVKAFCRPNV